MASNSSSELNRSNNVPPEASVAPDLPAQQPSMPDVHSNQVGPVPQFEIDFKSSVAEKEQKWSKSRLGTNFANGLDRFLWKEVLHARVKVMRNFIYLSTRQDTEDWSTLQNLRSELHSDLNELCISPSLERSFLDREC